MTLELHMKSQSHTNQEEDSCSHRYPTSVFPRTAPGTFPRTVSPRPTQPAGKRIRLRTLHPRHFPTPHFLHGLIDHTIRILQKHPDRPVQPPPYRTPVGFTNPTPLFCSSSPPPFLHHQQHYSNTRPAPSTPRPRSTRNRTGRPACRLR